MATFYANRSYVAENLCVNKDNPAMHCNGQCQLDKKLKDTDNQNQPNTDKRLSFETTVFIFQNINMLPLEAPVLISTPRNGIYKPFALQSCLIKTLHPPAGFLKLS